jgi:hypothetical protein
VGGGLVVAILMAGIVLGMNANAEKKAANRPHNIALIKSIVAAFDCSCGECKKTLKDCECPTAEETNRYISKLVGKEKYSRKEIASKVNQRYGYLKSNS